MKIWNCFKQQTFQLGISADWENRIIIFFAFGFFIVSITIKKDPLDGWFFFTQKRRS